MLERSYLSVDVHPQLPLTDDETPVVEKYPDLVSAILLQVNQYRETGSIRLRNYAGDVEEDLARACEEVSREDPLGSYAIADIQSSYERIVLYYEATITIRYRRTQEQMDAVVPVTGSGAIRSALREALSEFTPEVALRVNYFSGDEAYIRSLVREAYYDTPAAALGMPKIEVSLYPQSGVQRIVELQLAYAEPAESLHQKSARLVSAASSVSAPILKEPLTQMGLISALYAALRELLPPQPAPEPGSTAYAALVEHNADSQGMALAFKLLCDQAGTDCAIVEGERDGAPYFWNIVAVEDGHRHVDPSTEGALLLTDSAFTELTGCTWNTSDYPLCGDGDLEPENEFPS